MEKNIYSVGQVNHYIKGIFSGDILLSSIFVKGEVSNCKYHTSGHIYFSLKDETGTLSCVMFRGERRGLAFPMKDGDKVIVGGAVDVYERGGSYQLYAREISLEGSGLLYERFLKMKRELEEMGMFDARYKQPIPKYSRRIGIVTAPTGAAIRDIQNIAHRRNPYVQLILYPAIVQGENAKESIVRGIETLDRENLDVIIVGRGGGSIEDLWAFNEEEVARAIFDCRTPVISAVGHETDTTIADFAADLRAPTPSAAAELAVFDYAEFRNLTGSYAEALTQRLNRKILSARNRAESCRVKLAYLSPQNRIREKRRRAADLEEAMNGAISEKISSARDRQERLSEDLQSAMTEKARRCRQKMEMLIERFKGLNPLDRLKSGFSYVRNASGRTIRSVKQVKPGEGLTIRVTDGTMDAAVVKIEPDRGV